jgi:FkbM family methyltransferase
MTTTWQSENETLEEATARVWERMAKEHPEFKREYDISNDPWGVEDLVCDNEQGFTPFPGAKVMDVGAANGVLSAFWALNGAQVVAYEANPEMCELLADMVKRTNLTNVEVKNAAVWTHTGTVVFSGWKFTDRKGYIARNGVIETPTGVLQDLANIKAANIERQKVEVPCVSLTEAIGDAIWDFVKIDIEGAEYGLLMDISNDVLKKRVRSMQVEYHPWGASPEQFAVLDKKMSEVFNLGRSWKNRYL